MSIRIHASNVVGLGATEVVQNLLPELENYLSPDIEEIFLANNNKKLSSYKSPIGNKITLFKRFYQSLYPDNRVFPFDKYYPSDSKILVLGDLPIRTYTEQILFYKTV